MRIRLLHLCSLCLLIASCLVVASASAFPAVYVGKSAGERLAYATHVVVMKKDPTTVVTFMPDYEGPLDAFALVTVVPADVTPERVKTLKREFVDRLEKITAPRFHEFWEMDPCEPGPPEQEWERSMKATSDTDFLGGAGFGPTKKIDKELFLNVNTEFKEGEYVFTLLGEGENAEQWLKQKGYRVPSGLGQALAAYISRGYKPLIGEIDAKRIELVGGDRAQLSPIQYYTEQPFDTVPVKIGLLSAPPKNKQEVFFYVLHPESRFEVKNYKTIFPPTNIEVDFKVKERMGEFYAALHDLIAAKEPNAFLAEYAWHSDGCGQPCATEPLMIHEILSLGGQIFEQSVPEAEKDVEPPEVTDKEKEELKAMLEVEGLTAKDKIDKKKQFETDRKTVAVRKALVARHKYVLSRLHYRYDTKNLPHDPKIGPTPGAVQGGIWIPKGKKGEVPTEVKQTSPNKFQVRYNHFHPLNIVLKCDNPERWKWGKAPRTYRGLRKIWQAEDLTRKDRQQIKPAAVVRTPISFLGLKAAPVDAGSEAGADAGTVTSDESSSCGCKLVGSPLHESSSWLLPLALGALIRRRRRHS